MLHAREITLGAIVLRIIMAEVLGGVIGSERGRMNRPAGMRTYMLVSIGSCVVMLINQYAYQVYGVGDPVRLGAQVVSGIVCKLPLWNIFQIFPIIGGHSICVHPIPHNPATQPLKRSAASAIKAPMKINTKHPNSATSKIKNCIHSRQYSV